ncbi:YceH family protein [Leptothrix discophora]|uniref:YceH family protein n=1 Tax=Leptothrix discophora TaxID=89 RepID=UPI00387E5AD8
MRDLTPVEARVLAVLVEKQATVPDTYPMSLNALQSGCNQKTAREPVMALTEPQILAALDELKSLSLVGEVSGSRVVRYDHNLPRGLGVPGAAGALLATLMLRGPQTAAELRANAERLHRFADVSSVEGFLEELAEKTPPRVIKLARAPGSRESRWTHLLCGPVDPALLVQAGGAPSSHAGGGSATDEELALLRAEHRQMQAEIAQLRAQVAKLAGELGVSLDDA